MDERAAAGAGARGVRSGCGGGVGGGWGRRCEAGGVRGARPAAAPPPPSPPLPATRRGPAAALPVRDAGLGGRCSGERRWGSPAGGAAEAGGGAAPAPA